jgi:hypothetical protein
MSEQPGWVYSGSLPLTGDLSALEAALHGGRVEAAELGYHHEPATIETEDAAWTGEGDDRRLVSAEEAEAAGVEFAPTVLRYRMVWAPEADGS